MACLRDHIEMCEYILEKYLDLNVKRTANDGQLHIMLLEGETTRVTKSKYFKCL